MYTQCPACKTVFRLHPEQIDAAHGQVRCSRCQTVFNALENLFQQGNAAPSLTPTESDRPETASIAAQEPVPGEEVAEEAEETTIEPLATPIEDSWLQEFSEPGGQETVHKAEPTWPLRDEEAPLAIEAQEEPAWLEAGPEIDEFEEEELPGLSEPEPAHEKADTAFAFEESRPEEQREHEDLPIFANEADESGTVTPDESVSDEPVGELLQPDAAADMPSAEDFDDELLSLFDEDEFASPKASANAYTEASTSHSLDEEILTPAPEALEPIATEAAPAEKEGPAESPVWSHFSEENIEALLSAGEEQEPLDDGGVFEQKNEPHPFAGVDELDLATGTEPGTEEDQALLNERLPEDQVVNELDLERIELKSDNRGAGAPEPATETAAQVAERPSYSLPLEQEVAGGGLFGTLFWGIGILLMFAALGLQYLYYHRTVLAENPQLRPLLTQMCGVTGCQLPPRRDLSKIELGNHLVQFHPRYENSLLITATLVNRADFSQPFPIVEVVMTDLQQKMIARRRFLPKEYLVGTSDTLEFSPGAEVPLMLEVVDPGKNAVGFEFNFY